eukprot:m.107980 g.107980  ORF g.107980 m.107980 type:complete len:470 (-) comp27836_c0_seq2:159-1568(-)
MMSDDPDSDGLCPSASSSTSDVKSVLTPPRWTNPDPIFDVSTDPATPSPVKPRSRGHNRQRSASWSAADAHTFVVENKRTPVDNSNKSPMIPLFVGVAPESDQAFQFHRYTPHKPLVSSQSSRSSNDLRSLGALDLSPTKATSPLSPRTEPPTPPQADVAPLNRADIMAERAVSTNFFKGKLCYDMIAESGKVVVFDTQLLVKKAFFAMVQHGLRAGILWNSSLQQYVGMITITDFIHILRKYYVSPLVKIDELEDHKIQTWRDVTDGRRPRTLLCIDPMASIYDALSTLLSEKIHRLPVIDNNTGNALSILTLKRILWFMREAFPWDQCPKLLKMTLQELKIGSTKNVAAVSPDTPLISVLNIFVERNISALPIIDEQGKVIDVYVKYDAIKLAEDRSYDNLDIAVTKALLHRPFTGAVLTCTLEDTLEDILQRVFKGFMPRLIIVDKQTRLIGILSLSDILSVFLVD